MRISIISSTGSKRALDMHMSTHVEIKITHYSPLGRLSDANFQHWGFACYMSVRSCLNDQLL